MDSTVTRRRGNSLLSQLEVDIPAQRGIVFGRSLCVRPRVYLSEAFFVARRPM